MIDLSFITPDFLTIHSPLIKALTGWGFVVWGYLDGVKYHFEAQKIREVQTSKGHSRKFINLALGNDGYRMFYFFFIDRNWYVLLTTVIALICMFEMYWAIYIYYPYKHYPQQKTISIKRPSLWAYFINSCIPNKRRPKL